MATSPVPVPPSQSTSVKLTGEEAVVRLMGTDPWMRFDVWAQNAWQAAERAVEVASSMGATMNPDDGLDHRIITHFHAAELAKTFAEMTNPLLAASDFRESSGSDDKESEVTIEMVIDSEGME